MHLYFIKIMHHNSIDSMLSGRLGGCFELLKSNLDLLKVFEFMFIVAESGVEERAPYFAVLKLCLRFFRSPTPS